MPPIHRRVLARYIQKTAGEVRFIKDRGSDKSEWGWNTPGPSAREIDQDFVFNPKFLKPLALTLRSALMALGHATSAHARLVKVKSRNVSPDGNLGGKGYIAKITDMRRQLMNCIESLSSLTDTLFDEIKAPHWTKDTLDARDREEVREIVEDSEEIRENPEDWAEDREEEMDEENEQEMKKLARILHASASPSLGVFRLATTLPRLAELSRTLPSTAENDVIARQIDEANRVLRAAMETSYV